MVVFTGGGGGCWGWGGVDQGRQTRLLSRTSKPEKSCHLYISTNAYVVGAQKNRLNLREREREREREKKIIAWKVVTIYKGKCFYARIQEFSSGGSRSI